MKGPREVSKEEEEMGARRPLPPVMSVALQAPLSMGFSRQEYWSGLLCPPPEDLPNPGIEPTSLTSPALAVGFFTTSATWEARELKLHNVNI